MSFESGNFVPQTEIENASTQKESRFGNKSEILKIMEQGNADILGSIDEMMPDAIEPHDNIVEVANITSPELIDLKYEDKELLCVFKPFSGENDKVKNENGDVDLKEYFPREYFAYQISEHFQFDIVPPTIVREINGRIGVLQLLINKNDYLSQKKIFNKNPKVDELQWDNLTESNDFGKMLALDFLLLNCDRNDGNFLVKIERNEEGEVLPGVSLDKRKASLIAIDHGLCMSSKLYLKVAGDKFGPIKIFTERHDNVRIPEELMSQLKSGFERKEEFDPDIIDNEIRPEEVDYLWERCAMLMKSDIFLSRCNIKNHHDLLKDEMSRHPQLYISA